MRVQTYNLYVETYDGDLFMFYRQSRVAIERLKHYYENHYRVLAFTTREHS